MIKTGREKSYSNACMNIEMDHFHCMHTRTHIVHTSYIDVVVIYVQGVVYDHVVKSHVETGHQPLKQNDTVLTPPQGQIFTPRVKFRRFDPRYEKSLKFDPPPKSLVPPPLVIRIAFLIFF